MSSIKKEILKAKKGVQKSVLAFLPQHQRDMIKNFQTIHKKLYGGRLITISDVIILSIQKALNQMEKQIHQMEKELKEKKAAMMEKIEDPKINL